MPAVTAPQAERLIPDDFPDFCPAMAFKVASAAEAPLSAVDELPDNQNEQLYPQSH
jgi:hypothetical protein